MMGKAGFSRVLGCVAVVVLLAAQAAGAAVRIVSPPDKVWVTNGDIFLSATANVKPGSKVDISGVKVNGKPALADGGVIGARISLRKGMNTIKVKAGPDVASVRVFFSPSRKKYTPPSDFREFYIHAAVDTTNCRTCHRFRRGAYDFKKIIPARAGCNVGKCHSDKGKAPHVHGPVGAGVCISCHNPHGSFLENEVAREGQDLCLVCHQARKEEFSQKVVHPALEDGCTGCHDPHQSEKRFQLRYEGDTIKGLCVNCHEGDMFEGSHIHSPVEEGDCIACHRPHSSPNEKLLIAPPDGGKICLTCHEDKADDLAMETVHAPVEEGCTECHDPHASANEYQLKKSMEKGALCAMCHEDATPEIYEAINTAKTRHPPVAEGKCTACHRPHGSANPSLLKKEMQKLCFSCHVELGDEVEPSRSKHGPVKTGDCTACHNVHGSQFARLLVRQFPLEFYSDYAPDKYDLCFGCHNKDIAKTRNTETLTNFRDGKYNLHYFHVNREKGRTCIACHDPHASDQYKHIRYEVPFGAWSYPISITKTKNGATCVVGCHAPKTYDRVNPKVKPSR